MSSLKPVMFDLVSKPDGPAAMKETVDTRERLQEELLNYDGPITAAIRNFIGVLQFYLGETQKALGCFQQVLDADPDNINAIQNSMFMYSKMMKDSDMNHLGNRLRDLLLDSSDSKVKEIKARFHAEQGYVMSFEFTFDRSSDVIDFKRFQIATSYFEKALGVDSSDIFSVEESCQWHFFAARTYHRFYDRYLVVPKQLSIIERDNILVRAMDLFHYVLTNSESDAYKSKAWCLLGTVMFKMPKDRKGEPTHTHLVERCIEECGFDSEYRDPSLCFEKALKLSPQDAKLVCRYARMFMGRYFCDLPRAIELLNKSIEMDSSKVNWLAFTSRGQAYRRLYKEDERKYRSSTRNPVAGKSAIFPNRDLLKSALKDFESSVELKPQFRGWVELGSVYHMLGRPSYNQPMHMEMMDKALCHFSQAVESLEGRKYSYLHLNRGQCLKDYGEIRGAIESYKTAMECEETPSGDQFIEAFRELMLLLLQKCRDEKLPQDLVSEVAFWFDCGFRSRHERVHFTVERCCREFAREMFVVCRELVKKQHYTVARFLLPTLVSALVAILGRCQRDGKPDKISVVREDLNAAEGMKKSLAAARENQPDRVGPVVPVVGMFNLSLSGDGEAVGDATAAAAQSNPATTLQAAEQRTNMKYSIGHPIEIARNTKNKKYDFFVLYSDVDREWILYTLIPKLEAYYHFKGFIRDRDIPFGEEETIEKIGWVVENSICTVAVLSKAFLQDSLLQRQLKWVFDETLDGEEDEHPIVLLKLSDCRITRVITKMSYTPVIDFYDWHKLVTTLSYLGKQR